MKALIFVLLFLPFLAQAALPPTTTKGNGDSSPVTTFEIDWPGVTFTHTGTKASIPALPNAALANSAVTVNGTTCTLGGSCSPSASAPVLSFHTCTTSCSVIDADDVVICNSSSAITVTLLAASGATKKMRYVKNINTGACTIASSDNIDGLATLVIPNQWGGVQVATDQTTWYGF